MSGEVATDIHDHLRSIAEQIRRIDHLVENDDCCIDIIVQIIAVQRAMRKLNRMVLNHYLHICAISAVFGPDADERERAIEGIWSVFCATDKM